MEKQITSLYPGILVSPIDGRYHEKTKELGKIFSEKGLMCYRVEVEIEYLIALDSILPNITGDRLFRKLKSPEREFLRDLYTEFSDEDFTTIKGYEKTTNHDVKAVEYFIRAKLNGTSLDDISGFVHYGRTSEDINNLAYASMLRDGTGVLLKCYEKLLEEMATLAYNSQTTPLLALTHGQPASTTTLGWEINIFSERLRKTIKKIKDFTLLVKWNGATGGDNALYAAHPEIDWREFSRRFILSISRNNGVDCRSFWGLDINEYTNQIEPHDTYAELFGILQEANVILISFAQNMWSYISREVFVQKAVDGEVGSSAMPQKINPINFENAEGNLGVANALFGFFSAKLPIFRYQRDLSDSTVERYFGVAYASTLIALKALSAGLGRLSINQYHIHDELEEHWEVIAEAYQVILRRERIKEGYELLLDITRGKKITKKILHNFIDKLYLEGKLPENAANELKAITPHNYIGNRNF
jgi:adenylosuccinate lyase